MESRKKEEYFEDVEDVDLKDTDLDEEIKAGEWQRLREFKTYRKRSRQGKIIATHQALSNRIAQLEKLFYQLVANQPQKAGKLLKEIKKLRALKEYLLQALIWEEQGQFDDHSTPDELEDII
ncbi:MAG TPA: hypothetical protein VHE53_01865 [Patescibacteria group bacterium]|nr:hypothetical protein [Patescibacteria group bacterium]